MGLKDNITNAFRSKVVETPKKSEYTPQIAFRKDTKKDVSHYLAEEFKGLIEQEKVQFPEDLGEEHPFNFVMTEQVYLKMGIVTGIVDKYVDSIVGPGFYVKSDDPRAEEIITMFIQDYNFDTVLRAWFKEALIKGNGYIEMGGAQNEVPEGLKILDAKYIYIDRDNKGKILGYNQYFGSYKKFASDKVTKFEENEIAHLSINRIGNNAYGVGLVYPGMNMINNLLMLEKESHTLLRRKANSPIHAKVGKYPEVEMSAGAITTFGKELEHLTSKTEFATDDLVDVKVIDFGNFGEKFEAFFKHDEDMLLFGFQVPEVLMGRGSIPEGLARVQMDAWERNIKSKQAEAEKIIENTIFKRVLLANGITAHVEFEWGQPSTTEKYDKIKLLTELLKIPTLMMKFSERIQLDIATTLDYKEVDIISPMQEREEEEKEPQPKVPKQESFVCNHSVTKIEGVDGIYSQQPNLEELHENEDITVQEWVGFNYREYENEVINAIDNYDFLEVAGITTEEVMAGKLSKNQIVALKNSLRVGIENNMSMQKIAAKIKEEVRPEDLYQVKNGKQVFDSNGDPKLAISKKYRPMMIARTETVRASNLGSLANYKKLGAEKYSWLTTISDRTCIYCSEMDGKIFEVGKGDYPPLHPMCRCSTMPIIKE